MDTDTAWLRRAGWALLLAAAFACVALIYVWAVRPEMDGDQVDMGGADSALQSPNVLLAGTVQTSHGFAPRRGATLVLTLHAPSGARVARIVRPISTRGVFVVHASDVPRFSASPDVLSAIASAEAEWHTADSANLTVRILPAGSAAAGESAAEQIAISPRRLHLRVTPYNPLLTVLVLLPAVFGLASAVLHLTHFGTGVRVTYTYALGVTALWSVVTTAMITVYAFRGYETIPLFFPDLFISSGVIVFSFLGSVVYVAFSVHQKPAEFFFAGSDTRKREALLAIAGRVLVAPYVAMAAYGIFAATFPTLRTGAFAAFFGFFTGLWIKVVLDALNDIGLRFLSAEERGKVVERMKRAEAPEVPAPPSRIGLAVPDRAFLDAVAAARTELLARRGVIGVAPGCKPAPAGGSPQPSIVALVLEKKDDVDDEARVPPTLFGFPTDVVAVPPADHGAICHGVMSAVSWGKVHADNAARRTATNLPDPTVRRSGHVVVISDPARALFNMDASEVHGIFDVLGAFKAAGASLPADVDFVSFVLDTEPRAPEAIKLPIVGDYHVGVRSAVEGINYFRPGNPGSAAEPNVWGHPRLLACTVHSLLEALRPRRYLHELGHSWCAYATYTDPKTGIERPDLQIDPCSPQGRFHWSASLDAGRSCMDYDEEEWIALGGDLFQRRRIGADDFRYCELDLYLMGLLRPDRVRPMRVLRDAVATGPDTVRANVDAIAIEQVIAACGTRRPAAGQDRTSFRQVFVVVTRRPDPGDFVARVDAFRDQFGARFRNATDGLGSVRTDLG